MVNHGRKTTRISALELMLIVRIKIGRVTARHARIFVRDRLAAIGHLNNAARDAGETQISVPKTMRELAEAYALLSDYQCGRIQSGREISPKELALVQALLVDLLPTQSLPARADQDAFKDLFFDLAREDTKWNHALGDALSEFYREVAEGQKEDGINTLKRFVDACPSKWYRSHAETELENIKNDPSTPPGLV